MPNASKRPAHSPTTTETHSGSKPPAPAMSREEWLRAMRGVGQLPEQAQIGKLKELFDRCPSPRTEAFDPAVIAACLGDIQKVQERHKHRSENPQDSVLGFVADQFKQNTGISVEDGNAFVAAGLLIRRALHGEPIDGQLLKQSDQFLFGLLRLEGNRRSFPATLEVRVRLAVKMNDVDFFKKLGEALAKPASFKGTIRLKDFQLGSPKTFLAENWTKLKDCPDKIGLCDFAWSALAEFFRLKFVGYDGSIRDLARDANLVKSTKPTIKSVKVFSREIWQTDTEGKRVRLLSAGQVPLSKA